jgi:hypothetical protein
MAYKTLYFKAEGWNQNVLEQWNGEENEIESIKRKTKKKRIRETKRAKESNKGKRRRRRRRKGKRKTAWLSNYSITLLCINTTLRLLQEQSPDVFSYIY